MHGAHFVDFVLKACCFAEKAAVHHDRIFDVADGARGKSGESKAAQRA